MKKYNIYIDLYPVDIDDYNYKKSLVYNHLKTAGIIHEINDTFNGFNCIFSSDLSANEIRKLLKSLDIYVDYNIY